MRAHRYNISRLAEDIGASRSLVYRLLEHHGVRVKGDDAQDEKWQAAPDAALGGEVVVAEARCFEPR